MDGDYGANDWSGPLAFRHSLYLLATVMSVPTATRAVVDAGLKSTTIECGLPQVAGRAGLRYAAANDEHGVLEVAADAALRLGETLLLDRKSTRLNSSH